MSDQFATREDFIPAGGAPVRRYKDGRLWNGSKILIRSLTEAEWSAIDIQSTNLTKGGFDPNGVRLSDVRLIVATVCDANPDSPTYKEPLFGEQDIPAMFKGSDTILVQPLIREIREHCGLVKSVEDLLKNSGTTTVADSPHSSQEQSNKPPT